MSSLFRAPGLRRARPYTPDPSRVFDRAYLLDFQQDPGLFQLHRAWEIFGLPEDHPDTMVQLVPDRAAGEAGEFVLVFGPDSTLPRAALAPLSALTRVRFGRNRYMHERDWPAENEPAVEVNLMLHFGPRTLVLGRTDYAKFSYDYMQPAFVWWLRDLARECGAEFEERYGSERSAGTR